MRECIRFLDSLFKRSLQQTSFAIQPVISKIKHTDDDYSFSCTRHALKEIALDLLIKFTQDNKLKQEVRKFIQDKVAEKE